METPALYWDRMLSSTLSPARRQSQLILSCLTLFLLILPLTLSKPGLPVVLKADEAAFYLASLSLWHDGDLVCEDQDVRRLFREYAGTDNLLLMSKGRRQPVYFSIPITYPLIATPFVALFGANGMVTLNAALLMAMVWMGFAYLRRFNDEVDSALFAAGFFLLSTAFVYMFWLQAELLNMTCVMTAFFLMTRAVDEPGLSAERQPSSQHLGRTRFVRHRLPLHAAGSAAMLAIACYSKPMLAALGLPILFLLVKARSWRSLVSFAAAGLLTVGALVGTAYALTEQVWPYFAPRFGTSVSSPVDYMQRRVDPRIPKAPSDSAASQITRSGRQLKVTMATVLKESTPEFLFGRHGGFFIYMPFAVLSILFFLLRERRCVFRWLILLSAVLTAALFVMLIRGQWLGGGGFVGNRFFTAVYPCFLFLVRRLQPSWLITLGFVGAAVFLGPLLITPLGALVTHPTLQAHVRNQPFPQLPLEWSLARNLSGYRQISLPDASLHGRRDEIMAQNEEIWIQGAKRVEMNLLSPHQDQSFVFDVRNLAPGNTIEICLLNDCRQLNFDDDLPGTGGKKRLVFEPQHVNKIPRSAWGTDVYRYPLVVTSEWGEQPLWRGSGSERFYLGAALAFLGTPKDLARDLHPVEWLKVEAPLSMDASNTVTVPIILRNASTHLWPGSGATQVKVSYHWLRETGDPVIWAGRRTELPDHIAAGQEVEMDVLVDTPEVAGSFILVFDLIRERINWFSAVDEEQAYRVPVEVVVPDAG